MLAIRGLVLVVVVGVACLGVAQDVTVTSKSESESDTQNEDWPPAWIEGAWKVDSVELTFNGAPTERKFSSPTHVLFTAGHRFSVTKGTRISGSPMIAQSFKSQTLSCLFPVSKTREAIRARFSQIGGFSEHPETLEYVTYLAMPGEAGRFRFVNKISRITDETEFAVLLKKTSTNLMISCPCSEDARGILKSWVQERLESAKP